MKQTKKDHIHLNLKVLHVWSEDQSKHQLYAFFALLMKIDKRSNPKNYEHQKSRNSSDQTS